MDQTSSPTETQHQSVTFAEGLTLDCGRRLNSLTVAYRCYGTLNAARSNAILICHALTGDQYVAETNPETGKPGWWDRVVGPGRPVDTDKFFVICTNVLGGCMGTTGPRSPHDVIPEHPWGTDFPPVTIEDMVRAQKKFIDHLGIDRLFAVVGGSMGGMQTLAWAALYPETVFAAVPVAAAAYHSAQNIAFHEIGRQAIAADPFFYGGRYWSEGVTPERGLAVARMTAHITYVSEAALTRKFGRKLQDAATLSELGDRFEVRATCNTRAPASSADLTRMPTSPSPARWICSTSPPPMTASSPKPSPAPKPASCWSPSAPTGCSPPPSPAPSPARSTMSPPTSPSWKSPRTRAMTPFSSTSRISTAPCAASSPAAPNMLA